MNKNMLFAFTITLLFFHTIGLGAAKTHTMAHIEQGGIIVEYGHVAGYTAYKFRSPHFITITNKSDKPVLIEPSIIANSLVGYDEITKRSRIKTNLLLGITTIPEFVIGMLLMAITNGKRSTNAIIAVGSVLAIYGTQKGFRLLQKNFEDLCNKTMLREPFIINPGETVQKIFWVKESNKPMNINFNAVQYQEEGSAN